VEKEGREGRGERTLMLGHTAEREVDRKPKDLCSLAFISDLDLSS
jgi:hypothetical protein